MAMSDRFKVINQDLIALAEEYAREENLELLDLYLCQWGATEEKLVLTLKFPNGKHEHFYFPDLESAKGDKI